MSTHQKFAALIEKKQAELLDLEKQAAEARSYISGIKDAQKLLPKAEGHKVSLREGSDVAKARDAIKEAGRPMHIDQILLSIGKELNKKNKLSLAGSLSGYVRNKSVFDKPAPNTFGLIGMDGEPINAIGLFDDFEPEDPND